MERVRVGTSGWTYAAGVFDLLRDHDVALCISDHHDAPSPWEETASFLYLRARGPGGRYVGRYPRQTLDGWARRIAAFPGPAFAYFDNDIEAAAPDDARALLAKVKKDAKV